MNFNSRLTDEALIALCSALAPYGSYIEDIDLRFNQLGDLGARALGDLLSRANRLLGLNLQGNKIKTNGAMMITELLFTHDKLLSLNLADNKIDHDGIIGILSVLNSSNYTLEELNIDNPVYKTICQSVAIHFGKMFQNNVGLQKLSI